MEAIDGFLMSTNMRSFDLVLSPVFKTNFKLFISELEKGFLHVFNSYALASNFRSLILHVTSSVFTPRCRFQIIYTVFAVTVSFHLHLTFCGLCWLGCCLKCNMS